MTISPVSRADDLRVMSFNIRYDTAADDPDAWPNRREMVLDTIGAFDPDLAGLQEVLPSQAEVLKQRFGSRYVFVGVPREDGIARGEIALVLFRRERFEQRRSGTFWLSETPDVVGSRGWDAACVRDVTWAELIDRRGGDHSVLFLNTHWDHEGELARRESARLMRRRIAELAGDGAVIITGDFNADAGSEAYRLLLGESERLRLADTFVDVHARSVMETFTFHGFSGRGTERIDWILRSAALCTRGAGIDRSCWHGRYPSDHFAVTAVVGWGR